MENQPTDKQRANWSDLGKLIYAELESRPDGMHWDDLVKMFASYVEPGKRVSSVISATLAGFSKTNLAWHSADNNWHAGSANTPPTPKGINPNLKAYMKDRKGRIFQVFTDPQIIQDVVSVEFTPDGKTWYPIAFNSNMKMCIGHDIPDWGTDMNPYHNVFAYRIFARRGGSIDLVSDENIHQMGLIITIAPQ